MRVLYTFGILYIYLKTKALLLRLLLLPLPPVPTVVGVAVVVVTVSTLSYSTHRKNFDDELIERKRATDKIPNIKCRTIARQAVYVYNNYIPTCM